MTRGRDRKQAFIRGEKASLSKEETKDGWKQKENTDAKTTLWDSFMFQHHIQQQDCLLNILQKLYNIFILLKLKKNVSKHTNNFIN